MKPEIRRDVEDLFHQALLLRPEERTAYLKKHCPNNESLRREVESLLSEYGAAGSFLERAPVPSRVSQEGLEMDTASELHNGARIGPYEILELIGAGGMGQVYRAVDTRLKRDVAIKVLPEAFAHDADRLSRFQREAKMLASLNHPNIATIHGLEQSDNTSYLVMEMVTGETLQERIERDGAIPIDDALAIAKQIAEALEAAHEKGIIHRDLKPANIKITPDGKVKVLDFGLAKAMESVPAAAAVSNSPTLSLAATNEGIILGTAAYMSPEQAKGKTVDRRTDIWAFGAVLYEMLTGRMMFAGETVSEILAAVMMKEPDWTALPENTPARLHELVCGCVVKEPRSRIQAIGDARIAMEKVLSGPEVDDHIARAASRGRERITWLSFVALLSLIVVVLGVRALRPSPPAPPSEEMRTEIVTPASDDSSSFALSPDGRQLVFAASGDGTSRLWLRPLSSTTAQPLAGTEGAMDPFWSPDSRSVGFFADGKLKRLDIGGGSPQVLADAASVGGAWNADGVILFAQNGQGPLFRVSASGGGAVAVTKLDRQLGHRFPHFMPDGRRFLFYANGNVAPETGGIYLGSLDSSLMKRLTAADTAGVYAPAGWLLWVRAGTLVAKRLDLERTELAGDSVSVADPVAVYANYVGAFSVSAAGLIAYRSGAVNRSQLTWFDSAGKPLGAFGVGGPLVTPRVSPDGRHVAVRRTVQSNSDIWLMDGIRTSRFTFDPAQDGNPVWAPDGSRIVFDSSRKGVRNLYVKPSSGESGEELLLESSQDKLAQDWSRDGRFLLYQSIDPQTGRDLWVLPLEGERKPWPFLKTNFGERGAQFSPDGRWVAYMSNESGRMEIYVRPFVEPAATATDRATRDRAAGQWQVSTAGGIYPRWRRDGKEIFYIAPDGQMMASTVTALSTTLQLGAPVAKFQTHMYGGGTDSGQAAQYDLAPDGRFLINTVDDSASPITLIQNWHPEIHGK